jgi:hypothetical protein
VFEKRKAAKAKALQDTELKEFVQTLVGSDGSLSEDKQAQFGRYLGDHGYTDEQGVVRTSQLPEEVANTITLGMAMAGRFARCETSLLLKRDETAYCEVAANLLKEVTDRELRGRSQGVSIPLGHGVRYRTGAVRGHMVTVGTHWQTADTGALTVTNQRIVYHGGRKTLEFTFAKLATLNAYSDAIDLGVTSRQATSTFAITDPEYVSGMIHAALNASNS